MKGRWLAAPLGLLVLVWLLRGAKWLPPTPDHATGQGGISLELAFRSAEDVVAVMREADPTAVLRVVSEEGGVNDPNSDQMWTVINRSGIGVPGMVQLQVNRERFVDFVRTHPQQSYGLELSKLLDLTLTPQGTGAPIHAQLPSWRTPKAVTTLPAGPYRIEAHAGDLHLLVAEGRHQRPADHWTQRITGGRVRSRPGTDPVRRFLHQQVSRYLLEGLTSAWDGVIAFNQK